MSRRKFICIMPRFAQNVEPSSLIPQLHLGVAIRPNRLTMNRIIAQTAALRITISAGFGVLPNP